MKGKTSIVLFLSIIGLIIFDAAQQKYYLDTFDLVPEGIQITFGGLLIQHLIRWSIWLIVNIPFIAFVYKAFSKNDNPGFTKRLHIIFFLVATVVVSLAGVSILTLSLKGIVVETKNFLEFFYFFLFQKGLTFTITSVMLSLLILNYTRGRKLEAQQIEITYLLKSQSELEQALSNETIPYLTVKTGYKEKPIALEDIIWIQADDYCVKIHTSNQSFTLRQSLKTLEKKLSSYRFARIHRGALLNLSYLDQINYQRSSVMLKDRSEIPFSKTGIKSLQAKIASTTL